MKSSDILRVNNLDVEIGGKDILHDVSFQINPGDKIGIVGENGAGKSTFLKAISGEIPAKNGEIFGAENVDKMDQNLDFSVDETSRNFLERKLNLEDISRKMSEIYEEISRNPSKENFAKLAKIQEEYDNSGIYDFENKLEKRLSEIELENEILAKKFRELSGGQKQKIGILATMLSEKNIILMDEPTNNLDTENKKILEDFINGSDKSFAFVSHDREFLRKVSRKIIEISRNDGLTEYDMNYDEFEKTRKNLKNSELKNYEQQKKEDKKLKKQMRDLRIRENTNRRGAKKSTDNNKLAFNARAAGGEKAADKTRKNLNKKVAEHDVENFIMDFALDFDIVEKDKKYGRVNVKNLMVKYDDKTIAPKDFAINVGERKRVVGENGVGKSSVITAILGENEFIKSGEIAKSPQIKIGYIDQSQNMKNKDENVVENFAKMADEPMAEHDIRQLLIKFGIKKEDLDMPVRKLSSGQRMKALLAAMSVNKPDIIMMDEPTNNLDIATIEGLENALNNYQGGLLIVSHDEEFAKNISVNDIDIF